MTRSVLLGSPLGWNREPRLRGEVFKLPPTPVGAYAASVADNMRAVQQSAGSAAHARRWLAVALLVHLLLAGTYAWRTPAWEGPDESDHAFYAMFLAATGRQPTILGSGAQTGRAGYEEAPLGHHPPLYYWLLGKIAAVSGHADVTPFWSPNSAFGTDQPTGALKWLHGHDETTRVSAEIGVLRAQRGLGVLCGAVTIWLAFGLARALFAERGEVAAVAAVLLAAWPQWSFMHGVLDNGNLAATLATATALLLVRALQAGLTSPRALALGAVLGAALLTKLTALFLLPLVAVVSALAWLAKRASLARALRFASLVAVVALALSGAWFWRNFQLYGDPLALAPHAVAYAGNKVPEGMRYAYLTGDFVPKTLQSLFAGIGWALRPAPDAVQWAAVALVVAGALGFLLRARALLRGRGVEVLVAVCAVGLAIAGVVQFNLTFIQPQGRYLFPGLPAFLVLLAAGLAAPRPRGVFCAGLLLGAVALQHVWFLPQLRPGAPPDALYASYQAGLRTPGETSIVALAPADGHHSDVPPEFAWRDDNAPPGCRYTLQLTIPGALTVGSFETARLALAGGSWQLLEQFWHGLPKGQPVRWRVRRLADRSRGEDQFAQPCTPWQTLTRR